MNRREQRRLVLDAQTESGAFPSFARLPRGPVEDENAFVTALVVDLLCKAEIDPEIAAAIERGCRFISTCENPHRPGAFAFYPRGRHPGWLGETLPDDADDTALCGLALLHAGYLRPRDLLRTFHQVLEPYRINERPRGPGWFRRSVFPTWLDTRRMRNPIDVCLNLNVAVMTHEAGLAPRYRVGIMEMIDASLDAVADHPDDLGVIMPFYPSPWELGYALKRAEQAGVGEARRLLEKFATLRLANRENNADRPICCSLGAGVAWLSPVLACARDWILGER
jgi:hypothetical protein